MYRRHLTATLKRRRMSWRRRLSRVSISWHWRVDSVGCVIIGRWANHTEHSGRHYTCQSARRLTSTEHTEVAYITSWFLHCQWRAGWALICLHAACEILKSCVCVLLLACCNRSSFWKTNIAQRIVGTCFRGGAIFNQRFIVNLLPKVAVKKFWELVNISKRYGQKSAVVDKSQIESFPQISNHLGKWFKSSCQISNLKSLKNFKSQIFVSINRKWTWNVHCEKLFAHLLNGKKQ